MFTALATAATAGKSTAVAALAGLPGVVAQTNPFGDLASPMCAAIDNLWLMALVFGIIMAFLGGAWGAIGHVWRGDPGGLIVTAGRYAACAFIMSLLPTIILIGARDDLEAFACIP